MSLPLARTVRRLEGVVLVVGALAGMTALAWLVLAPTLGLSLVVLRTGSMSPTMPAGTAAVAQSVPASAVRVGDVVTARRDGASPLVTHRVVSVAPVAGSPDVRQLVLRGDANDTVDLFPYEVDRVLRTSWSLPGAGTALTRAQQPSVLVAVVLGTGLLVLRAFWPEPLPVIEAELAARAADEEDRCAPLDTVTADSSPLLSRRS